MILWIDKEKRQFCIANKVFRDGQGRRGWKGESTFYCEEMDLNDPHNEEICFLAAPQLTKEDFDFVKRILSE